MKLKILLTFLFAAFTASVIAQKKQTAFAITGPQKGNSGWTEVRLLDLKTGNEIRSIYKKTQEVTPLNARTGKAIQKKEHPVKSSPQKLQVISTTERRDASGNIISERVIRNISVQPRSNYDQPFSTNSAACAYDKKHDRLYYTPMRINELRYIDLKSNTPKVYYFENEDFGVLKNSRDVANQITRMVIASDGNGYALTNNARNLIRFTTNKKSVITNLGAITDDPSNGRNSIHHTSCFGGDMVAHKNGDLYLITASRKVFHIDMENKTAKYLGTILGLPKGFTTNGAMADEGMNVIVCSSNSTLGYFRFDINTLEAEKISENSAVYNASDLANANLLSEKKKRKKDQVKQDVLPVESKPEPIAETKQKPTLQQLAAKNSLAIYPNPVSNGLVKLEFRDQQEGKYKIQLLDISGKLVSMQEVNITNKIQVHEFKLPTLITAGNYLIQVTDMSGKVVNTENLIVKQ